MLLVSGEDYVSVQRDQSDSSRLSLGLASCLDAFVILRPLREPSGAIEDFSHVEINERAREYLGVGNKDLTTATLRDIWPSSTGAELVSLLAGVVTTGAPAERRGMPLVLADLVRRRFDVRAIVDGDLVGLIFRDPGEVREVLDHYQLLLESSSDMVVQLDRDGKIVWLLDPHRNTLGYQPGELVGTNFDLLMKSETLVSKPRRYENVRLAQANHFQVELRGHDGRFQPFSAVRRAVIDQHGVTTGAVVFLHLIDPAVALLEFERDEDEFYRLIGRHGNDVESIERGGVIEWVSQYVQRLFGLRRADVLGRSLADLVHPDDRASIQSLARDSGTEESKSLTVRMRQEDSSYRWVSIRSRVVLDETSGATWRVSSWRDAEGEVAAQQALLAVERRFRIVAENSNDVVIECDDEGVIQWVSPSSLTTLGCRDENLVGTRLEDRVVGSERSRVTQQRTDCRSFQRSEPIEIPVVTSTGDVKWMSHQIRRARGSEGDRSVFIVTLRDVGELVALRRDAAEAGSRFALMANNARDVIYTVNFDGELTWVSPSAARELGWLAGDLLGHDVLELVFEEDQPRVLAWRQLLHFGEVLDEFTMRVRHASGHFVWVRVSAQPTRDGDGRVNGAVVALRNCDDEIVSARALRTMTAGSRALIRERDPHSLLRQMCQVAVDEGGYALAWYGRKMFDDAKSVEVVTSSGGRESYMVNLTVSWGSGETSEGPAGRSIRLGQACAVNEVKTDPKFASWRDRALAQGFGSTVAIPVLVNGEIAGTWVIYALEQDAFAPEVLAVLEDLALEIGYGLSRLSATPT